MQCVLVRSLLFYIATFLFSHVRNAEAQGLVDEWFASYGKKDIGELLARAPVQAPVELDAYSVDEYDSWDDYDDMSALGYGFESPEDRDDFTESLINAIRADPVISNSPSLRGAFEFGVGDAVKAEGYVRQLQEVKTADTAVSTAVVQAFADRLHRLIETINQAVSDYASPDGNITQTLDATFRRFPPLSATQMEALLASTTWANFVVQFERGACGNATEKSAGMMRDTTAFPQCLFEAAATMSKDKDAVRENKKLVARALADKNYTAGLFDASSGICAPVAFALRLPESACEEMKQVFLSMPEVITASAQIARLPAGAGLPALPAKKYKTMHVAPGIMIQDEYTSIEALEEETGRYMNKLVFSSLWRYLALRPIRVEEWKMHEAGREEVWQYALPLFRWMTYTGLWLRQQPPLLIREP